MARILWDDLRDRVRDRADQETTQPTKSLITNAQLDKRLNESCSAFHDRVVQLQRHEWALSPQKRESYTVVANQETYNLPLDCHTVVAVSVTDGTFSDPVLPYDSTERAGLEGDYAQSLAASRWGFSYRAEGRQIRVLPAMSGSVTELRVNYIPEYKPRIEGEFLEVPFGWWAWPMLHCAAGMLAKQDRSADALWAEWRQCDQRVEALAGRRSPRALRVVAARDDLVDEDMPVGVGRMWPS